MDEIIEKIDIEIHKSFLYDKNIKPVKYDDSIIKLNIPIVTNKDYFNCNDSSWIRYFDKYFVAADMDKFSYVFSFSPHNLVLDKPQVDGCIFYLVLSYKINFADKIGDFIETFKIALKLHTKNFNDNNIELNKTAEKNNELQKDKSLKEHELINIPWQEYKDKCKNVQ